MISNPMKRYLQSEDPFSRHSSIKPMKAKMNAINDMPMQMYMIIGSADMSQSFMLSLISYVLIL